MHPTEKPWLEKYRPTTLSDVVGNTDAIDRFKVIAEQGNMPHLIISGPPGIGKTTSLMCMAHALLGDCFKDAFLELNASDERGIDVVRTRIKLFATKKIALPANRHKIILLDEVDSMTVGAQQALRRIMEVYSNTTRFALACNLSNKVIEPIQSRCAIVRFTKLTDGEMLKRLIDIVTKENVPHTPEGLHALIFSAEGDMRQAINNLQSTAASSNIVNPESVFKICDQPHPAKLEALVRSVSSADSGMNGYESAFQIIEELWKQGYSPVDIVNSLFKVVKATALLDEYLQLEFIREIGLVQMKLLEGSSSLLQLGALVAKLCIASSVVKKEGFKLSASQQ